LAAQSELLRGPGTEQLVAARVRLEARLLVDRKLLLETFFTLVERRHRFLVAIGATAFVEKVLRGWGSSSCGCS
jgi:hypothetical protein